MNGLVEIVDLIVRGGLATLLIVILYGGFKKEPWWVFGWVYREAERRNTLIMDEMAAWREAALAGTEAAKVLAAKTKGETR